MTLRGDATGSGRTYTDEICADPELTAFANRVTVEGDEGLSDAQAEGELTLADGRKLAIRHDLDALIPKSVLAGKLRTKAEAVLGPRGIAIWDRLAALDDMDARTLGNGLSG